MAERIAGFNWVDDTTLEISGVGYLHLRPEFIAQHLSGRGEITDTPIVAAAIARAFDAGRGVRAQPEAWGRCPKNEIGETIHIYEIGHSHCACGAMRSP